MKKATQMLIAGLATFAVLSSPIYASAGPKEDASELKGLMPRILTVNDICYKKFEINDALYKIEASTINELEIEVYTKGKICKFIDKGADGTLDLFIGSGGYKFTAEDTPSEKWKKIEAKYHGVLKEILPVAKKILKEKSSSLDEDLKDLE